MRIFIFVVFIAVALQVATARRARSEANIASESAPSAGDSSDNGQGDLPPAPSYLADGDCTAGDCRCGNSHYCGDNEVHSCVNPRLGCTDSCDHRLKNAAFCSALKSFNCPCMQCQCREGYARDSNGVCVTFSKCPANVKCGDNEYFSTCKSKCFTDSCDSKDLAARNDICNDWCDGEAGCVCEVDYARHPSTNKCILKKDCPSGCPSNELAVSCKLCYPSDSCAESANPNKKAISTCKPQPPANCSSGCICKKDHYRSPYAFNQCVPLCDCPKANNTGSIGSTGSGSPAPTAPNRLPTAAGASPGFFPIANAQAPSRSF